MEKRTIGGVLEMEYISKFPASVPILLQEMGRELQKVM